MVVLPMARQFNKWTSSLIDALSKPAESIDARKAKILSTLSAALQAAALLKPTVTFEHFCHETKNFTEMMCSRDPKFISEGMPHIKILSKVGITPADFDGFDRDKRDMVMRHIGILGEMSNDFHDFIKVQQQQQQPAGYADALALAKQIIPPELLAQVNMSTPGGLEAMMQQVMSNMNTVTGIDSAGAIGASDLMGLFGQFKTQFGGVAVDTPEERNALIQGVLGWFEQQSNKSGSLVCNLLDKFQIMFPAGISNTEIVSSLGRLRGFINMLGATRGDSIWLVFRTLTMYIKGAQEKTGDTPITRDNLISKLSIVVQTFVDDPKSEDLIEAATGSSTLKLIAGQFLGIPLGEISKDPFAAHPPQQQPTMPGGGGLMAQLGAFLGRGGGGGSPQSSDAEDEEGEGDTA